MRKKLFIFFVATVLSVTSYAQNPIFWDSSDYKPLKHMDIGVTAGTTGFGLEVGTFLNKNIKVRAGFAYMPTLTKSYAHQMSSLSTISGDNYQERLQNLIGYLRDMTGYDGIDDKVLVDKEFQFWNAKLLVDWYPFKNKHWHFTAGVFAGSKEFAKAYSDPSESTTMVAVNMYNNMYDDISSLGPNENPVISIGGMSMELDPVTGQVVKNAFNRYGRVAVVCGYYPDGTPYSLTPDPDGVMRAWAECYVVKPYFGAGYATHLDRNRRWQFGVELGVMVWSTNNTCVYTRDNVCLVHDIESTGDWEDIELLKKFPVYPNLQVRLAYTIF